MIDVRAWRRLTAAVVWVVAAPLAELLVGDRPTLLGLLVVVRFVAIWVAVVELSTLRPSQRRSPPSRCR